MKHYIIRGGFEGKKRLELLSRAMCGRYTDVGLAAAAPADVSPDSFV